MLGNPGERGFQVSGMNEQQPEEIGQKIVCIIDRSTSAIILWSWALVTFMQIPDNRLHHALSIVSRYIQSMGGPSLY